VLDAVRRTASVAWRRTAKVFAVKTAAMSTKKKGRKRRSPRMSAVFAKQTITLWM
jgi:hypothetical protein